MTLSDAFRWVGGVLALLLGVIFLVATPPVGVVLLLLGLYVLPAVEFDADASLADATAWLCGIGLVVLGGLFLMELPIAGALGVAAGAFALPPVRGRLGAVAGREIGRGVAVAVVLVTAGAAVGVVYANQDQLESDTPAVHDVNETFAVQSEAGPVAFTVEDVHQAWTLDPDERSNTSGDPILVLTLGLENEGNESVTIARNQLVVLTDDGDAVANASTTSGTVESGHRYDADGLVLADGGRELEGGERIRRTVVFEAQANESYLFTVRPDGPFEDAERHYVTLGRTGSG